MPEKNYPPIVRLRKIWVALALIGGMSVAMVILYHLYSSASLPSVHADTPNSHQQTFASKTDTKWYQAPEQPPAKSETLPAGGLEVSTNHARRTAPCLAVTDPDQLKAMGAAINSNQLTEDVATKMGANTTTSTVSLSPLKDPVSPYIIQAGTLIPGILMTGINADLPGQIIGQVRSPVYDSIQGRYVLIPQGSKLMGVYEAKIIYGQKRVLVAWQRLLLPNGQSLPLLDMAGVDNSGYAGFSDQVNAHYCQLLSSALLTSVLGAGASLSQPPTESTAVTEPPLRQALTQNVAASLMATASALTAKNVNLQPTIEIRPGFTFNIVVTQDMVFPHAYTPWTVGHSCAG